MTTRLMLMRLSATTGVRRRAWLVYPNYRQEYAGKRIQFQRGCALDPRGFAWNAFLDNAPLTRGTAGIASNPCGPSGQDLCDYDPPLKGWYVCGLGTVTPDERQVVPDLRTRLYAFTGAMINSGASPPADGPPPGDCCGNDGDPVNLATGLFTFEQTDVVLPDVLPIWLR